MKQSNDKKYRKFIRELIKELQYKIFINLYSIDIAYVDNPKKENKNCAAEIETSYRYYTAYISIYPITYKMWLDGKREEVAETIVHELCHIITDPLYKNIYFTKGNHRFIEDIREQTTQHIANIVMNYLRDMKPKLIGLK